MSASAKWGRLPPEGQGDRQMRGEMTSNTDDDNIEIIGGDMRAAAEDADGKSLTDLVAQAAKEAPEGKSLTDLAEQRGKVMRIGTMIKQLLEEVRAAPLDDASRNRLR